MPTSALIVSDYLQESPSRHLVYTDPADQIREIRKLIERVKLANIHWVHYCLDETDGLASGSEASDASDEEECDDCGRSCDCKKKEPRRKWTHDEHEEAIADLIAAKSLTEPAQWFALLEDISDGVLDDEVEFKWGAVLAAGEQVSAE